MRGEMEHCASRFCLNRIDLLPTVSRDINLPWIIDCHRDGIAPKIAQLPKRAQKQMVESVGHCHRVVYGFLCSKSRRIPLLMSFGIGVYRLGCIARMLGSGGHRP
jgi:hypothetical protein